MRISPILARIAATVLWWSAVGVCAAEEPEVDGFKLSEFPAPGEPALLKVLDTGEGEKRQLRYVFDAGSIHHTVTTARGSTLVELNGRVSPRTSVPVLKMFQLIKVVESNENGARLEMSLPREPEVSGADPALVEKLRNEFRGATSLLILANLSDRGVVREMQFRAPDASRALVDRLSESLDEMLVVLPPDAVGVGARWKVLKNSRKQGMSLYRVTGVELTRLAGSLITLRTEIEQFTPRQDFTMPEQAPGVTAEVLHAKGRGGSQVVIDLRAPVTSASGSVGVETLMRIRAERRGELTVRTNIHLEFDAAPGRE